MKKTIIIGIAIAVLLSCIATAQDNPYGNPYGSTYGYALQGYQHDYKSPFPFGGSSIYTDPDRAGPHRFTHYDQRVQPPREIKKTVFLEPPGGQEPLVRGFPAFAPRGNALIYSSTARAYALGQVVLKTKDIEASSKDNTYYEGWLFDADTGYRTSLGVFQATTFGNGLLQYNIDDYLDGYDYILVTKEPKPDLDPSPSQEVVLIGEIQAPVSYYKPFTSTQTDYGYVTKEASS
ncbi:hypothetical protein KY333_01515 [Candidatus Woesearchaeota archaeon]|nr:hypothetical protein [Candidatus Woesearchaeota archaeon]MBW2994594.1 hypothetical protein [Candidatus Woesearchaeota archaeon]